MKSIKPGRGPSFMSFISSICIALFGLLWTVIAFSITSNFGGIISLVFPLFGVIFIVIAIANAIYSYKNATAKNRYSAFDITSGDEEHDPLNIRFGETTTDGAAIDHTKDEKVSFCPYCGAKAQNGFKFCASCGKKLP